MISFTHSTQQKSWLQAKADRLNAIFNRSCTVGEREVFDARTNKTYSSCQFALTSTELLPLYDLAYPNGKKQFTTELLEGLTAEHLAVLWADDGNLEPKRRVGRLNLYEPKNQCEIVNIWIESICGAVGRYEDYEGNGFGRLRYPASEMVKIAIAIAPYLHESMSYKVDMQYKNNTKTKFALAVSSPNQAQVLLNELPEVSELRHRDWESIAKKVGVIDARNKSKETLRQCIVENLQKLSGR